MFVKSDFIVNALIRLFYYQVSIPITKKNAFVSLFSINRTSFPGSNFTF